MAGGTRGKSASPSKVKPSPAARARRGRSGSSFVHCPYCHTLTFYVLMSMHLAEDCDAAKVSRDKGLQKDSLRSVEETQQEVEEPGAVSQNGKAAPEEVDWVRDFSISRNEELAVYSEGEDGRFFAVDVGTDDEESEQGRSGRVPQPVNNNPVMELETQLEEETARKTTGGSGVGEDMISRKDFESVSDSSASLRKQFDDVCKEKEEVVAKLEKLTVEKQDVIEELLDESMRVHKANEELLADNNVREEKYDKWKKELQGRLIAQEEEAKSAHRNLRLLVIAKRELEDRLLAEEQAKKEAQKDAELQRKERQRLHEELTSLRAKFNNLQEELRQSIMSDKLLFHERLSHRKAILERYDVLMPGQSALSSVIVDMGDGEAHRTEPFKDAKHKLDCLIEELKSWPKLPEQVDSLVSVVKMVAEEAGAPLLSCDPERLKERSLPCEGDGSLSQHFFHGLEETEAQQTPDLPRYAVKFLTSLPPDISEAELPSSLPSDSSLVLPDKNPREQVQLKVTLSRPLLDLDGEMDSLDRDVRVGSDLAEKQPLGVMDKSRDELLPHGEISATKHWAPVTPSQVGGGNVSEHHIATGSPAETASPIHRIVTGPCDANVGRSISSLLAAFPPANGSPLSQVLSTPAQDVPVVTGKTSLAGPNNAKRCLNLEVASEKGGDVEQRLEAGVSAAAKSFDVPKRLDMDIIGKTDEHHPAASRENDQGHETPGADSESEGPMLVRSARKGKGSAARPPRRNQVVVSSDSESDLRRRLSPLRYPPCSSDKQQGTHAVNQESRQANHDASDDDVSEVSGSLWQRSTRRRMSFHGEGSHPEGREASLNDEIVASKLKESIGGINKTPGKRKEFLPLEDTGGASSPLKRPKHPLSDEGKLVALRRSRRLRKRQEVESDSILEEESRDDEPIRVTRGSAHKQEKVKKFVDLRKESDDEDEIEEDSSSGNSGFINDEPLSDNSCRGSQEGSEAGDSESCTMEVRPNPDHQDWELLGDMTAAFGKDDILCMRAVCALFRQQTQEEQALRITCRRNGVGFDMSGAKRGSELAVFLSAGDRDHRLTKSVAELKEMWPTGVEECRTLALRHAVQLFRLYKEELDAFPDQ